VEQTTDNKEVYLYKNEINSMREIMEAIVLEKNGSISIRKKMEVFSPIHADLQFLKTTN
jgi:uncharacterized membrane protein YcaP (DUF421 family)